MAERYVKPFWQMIKEAVQALGGSARNAGIGHCVLSKYPGTSRSAVRTQIGYCTVKRYTKSSLFRLLSNALYTGKVNYRGTIYEGEHEPIVEPQVWHRVQQLLRVNGWTDGKDVFHWNRQRKMWRKLQARRGTPA